MNNDYEPTPDRKLFGFSMRWILFGVVLLLVLAAIVYAISWVTTPLRLTDPARIERISREINEAHEALQAAKANVTSINGKIAAIRSLYGEDKSNWPQGKDDEYLQLLQQKTNLVLSYNSQCAAYRAKWANEWYSFVAPKDVPTSCEMITE